MGELSAQLWRSRAFAYAAVNDTKGIARALKKLANQPAAPRHVRRPEEGASAPRARGEADRHARSASSRGRWSARRCERQRRLASRCRPGSRGRSGRSVTSGRSSAKLTTVDVGQLALDELAHEAADVGLREEDRRAAGRALGDGFVTRRGGARRRRRARPRAASVRKLPAGGARDGVADRCLRWSDRAVRRRAASRRA